MYELKSLKEMLKYPTYTDWSKAPKKVLQAEINSRQARIDGAREKGVDESRLAKYVAQVEEMSVHI